MLNRVTFLHNLAPKFFSSFKIEILRSCFCCCWDHSYIELFNQHIYNHPYQIGLLIHESEAQGYRFCVQRHWAVVSFTLCSLSLLCTFGAFLLNVCWNRGCLYFFPLPLCLSVCFSEWTLNKGRQGRRLLIKTWVCKEDSPLFLPSLLVGCLFLRFLEPPASLFSVFFWI